jgi:Na+/H+ antiporter NhaD/arsenite permease-like protein
MLSILGEPSIVYFLSIGLSQIISNVPTAILISEFTPNWKPLLIGVNVGGLGTLVASLASLISYKIYTNEFQKDKKIYLKEFSILNIILLFLMSLVFYYNLDKI